MYFKQSIFTFISICHIIYLQKVAAYLPADAKDGTDFHDIEIIVLHCLKQNFISIL